MSRADSWVPGAGDLIWINFTPHAGREQAGHRPALVLSPREYNAKSGLAVCCALTSKVKGHPFEVPVRMRGSEGVVLADQVRNLDWRVRGAKFEEKAPLEVLQLVRDTLWALVGE